MYINFMYYTPVGSRSFTACHANVTALPLLCVEFYAKLPKVLDDLRGIMKTLLKRWIADIRGAAAIEYSLIASLISITIIGALGTVGTNLAQTFTVIARAMQPAAGGF